MYYLSASGLSQVRTNLTVYFAGQDQRAATAPKEILSLYSCALT
jgi:hypothetical protein